MFANYFRSVRFVCNHFLTKRKELPKNTLEVTKYLLTYENVPIMLR